MVFNSWHIGLCRKHGLCVSGRVVSHLDICERLSLQGIFLIELMPIVNAFTCTGAYAVLVMSGAEACGEPQLHARSGAGASTVKGRARPGLWPVRRHSIPTERSCCSAERVKGPIAVKAPAAPPCLSDSRQSHFLIAGVAKKE